MPLYVIGWILKFYPIWLAHLFVNDQKFDLYLENIQFHVQFFSIFRNLKKYFYFISNQVKMNICRNFFERKNLKTFVTFLVLVLTFVFFANFNSENVFRSPDYSQTASNRLETLRFNNLSNLSSPINHTKTDLDEQNSVLNNPIIFVGGKYSHSILMIDNVLLTPNISNRPWTIGNYSNEANFFKKS